MAESKINLLKGRFLLWALLIPLTLIVMALPVWVATIYALIWIIAASTEFIILYLKSFKVHYVLFLFSPLIIWLYTLNVTELPFSLHLAVAFLVQIILWLIISPGKPEQILPLLVLPLYLGFMPAHLVLLKQDSTAQSHGYMWLVFPFIIIWLNDTFAYLAGSLIGRTPLCPKISPKKTVEGFVAGVLLSAIVGSVFWILFQKDKPWWWGVLLALAVAMAGVLGDLLESAIKRERKVKNTSEILGGHGGFLDRIDSLIFGVLVYYYLYPFLTKL
ncbi:phosphatidate cytidylyltransferase [bacterium]|nr:phosphatidate cytidylyltransferase [bacterium]